MLETKRKNLADIIKSSGNSIFSKSDWDLKVLTQPGIMDAYAQGQTTDDQDQLIEAAITKRSAPRIETRKDPVTGNDFQVTIPGVLPPRVQKAVAERNKLGGKRPTTPSENAPADLTGITQPTEGGVVQPTAGRTAAPKQPTGVYKNQTDPLKVNPGLQNYYEDPQKRKTLYNQSVGTGLVPGITSTAYGIPLVGSFLGEDAAELSAKRKNLENVGLNISKGVAQNPRFAEGERNFIQNTLQLLPTYFDRPQAYAQRVFAFDSYLLGLQEEALKNSYNTQLPADVRQAARAKVADIHSVRMNVGAPIRIQDANDPRVLQLPSGTYYLFQDKDIYQKE
jgi:hypothetical protein